MGGEEDGAQAAEMSAEARCVRRRARGGILLQHRACRVPCPPAAPVFPCEAAARPAPAIRARARQARSARFSAGRGPALALTQIARRGRRDWEIEQLQRDKESLSHELELKAQLYNSELNLMREMLTGFKEEREVAFQRMSSLEQQKDTLQKEAERALELDETLKEAKEEVAELHEALKELEEELTLRKEEELARLRSEHGLSRGRGGVGREEAG